MNFDPQRQRNEHFRVLARPQARGKRTGTDSSTEEGAYGAAADSIATPASSASAPELDESAFSIGEEFGNADSITTIPYLRFFHLSDNKKEERTL